MKTAQQIITSAAFLTLQAACGVPPTKVPEAQATPGAATASPVVETRVGALSFERGYPTPETARKLYDEMDFQRATQAYLWGYPVVSFESIRLGVQKEFGLGENEFVIADNFLDPKSAWLTANDTTIYAAANIDLSKAGPVLIKIPPGAIVGIVDDFWQRSITDVGLPGPDKDKGGKFLLLPPGYSGPVPEDGTHVLKGTMNNYNLMVRGIVVNGDQRGAVERIKQLEVYPYSERAQPKATRFVSMSGKAFDTLPPSGIEFWARLSTVINNNPIEDRDRFFMAMLKPLGIEKGKPFQPDQRQRAILEDAAKLGDATARTMLFDVEQRISGTSAFADARWNWVVIGTPDQEAENYSQLDERIHYVYGAIYTSPFIGLRKAGAGSTYVQAFKDKDGKRLDGDRSYRLHIPAKAPAASFWSATLYDTATRSMIQNPRNDAALSSYDKLEANADGSIDLYFGPEAPAGPESNWIQTVPGQGFYPMVRFYAPLPPLFDGSWKLADVELVK